MRDSQTSAPDHPDSQKRLFLKKLVWAAPVVVATAAVKARAQEPTTNPDPPGCGPNS